jgi:hypothetical protein
LSNKSPVDGSARVFGGPVPLTLACENWDAPSSHEQAAYLFQLVNLTVFFFSIALITSSTETGLVNANESRHCSTVEHRRLDQSRSAQPSSFHLALDFHDGLPQARAHSFAASFRR